MGQAKWHQDCNPVTYPFFIFVFALIAKQGRVDPD